MIRYQYNLSILRLGDERVQNCKCPDHSSILDNGHGLIRTRYAGVNVAGELYFPWKETKDPLELKAMSVDTNEGYK